MRVPFSLQNKKIYIVSLGCAKNLVDSEKIVATFEKEGYPLTTDPEEAKYLIVNTCGFLKDAVEESIDTILDLAEIKKNDPTKKLIVTGCMVQRYREELLKELPEVDLFTGTGEFHNIPGFLKKGIKISAPIPRYIAWDIPRHLLTQSPIGYLKIAEGCSANCSFCIIPRLRGPQVSMSVDKLVEEAKWMAEQGVKELIIVAQDTTAYGRDLKDGTDLLKLLEALLNINGFRWIRLQYLYPEEFPKEFFNLFKNTSILPYFDIPIQHINDRILKQMNRRTNSKTIKELFERIKEKIPEAVIRTTVIVGFPGETEEEFDGLYRYLESSPVDFFGAFKFSPEEEAKASRFPNQIPEDIREKRLDAISKLGWEKLEDFYEKQKGKIVETLLESDWDNESLIGRAWFQGPEADGSILVKREATISPPLFTRVKILNNFSEFDGEMVE